MSGKNGSPSKKAKRATNGGVDLAKHLGSLRVAALRDVYAFWSGDESPTGTKKALSTELTRLMSEEGIVYRRVRTLTRKVLDVLLLLLQRESYASDLPGLFQRLPGEDPVALEYHEAEAGIKALVRRGFLGEVKPKGAHANGRMLFCVPGELGSLLTSLFREETRTVASVFGLAEHASAITATEREALRLAFPALPTRPTEGDAQIILSEEGAPGLVARLDEPMDKVVQYLMEQHGGACTRAQWSGRRQLTEVRWNRDSWSATLEGAGLGTVARMSLKNYGIALDDDLAVLFEEVLEDCVRRRSEAAPAFDSVLRAGCDLVADLDGFVEHVRRNPVKLSREGEVYKAGRRRIQKGFVFRESALAGPEEVWGHVSRAANQLGLVEPGADGFLEMRAQADTWRERPLEAKTTELYNLALEQPGPRGRSLHQHELRTIVSLLLREHPNRWWMERDLATLARHRYLGTLDRRGIKDRHRDRFFSAYFSGQETVEDLWTELHEQWLPQLYLLGLVDVGMQGERPRAWQLTALGARVLGAESKSIETGAQPLIVNPDFEVLVLPEGDVTDVIHTLDGWAQRVKTEDVVHFMLTRESVEAAVGRGRVIDDLLQFLEARSRGDLPQNVHYSLANWAGSVSFATLEPGVLLGTRDEATLDKILSVPEMEALLRRRLGPTEALLRAAPEDKKLLAALREKGIEFQVAESS